MEKGMGGELPPVSLHCFGKSPCQNIFPPGMNYYVLKYKSFNMSINATLYPSLLANFLFLILSVS